MTDNVRKFIDKFKDPIFDLFLIRCSMDELPLNTLIEGMTHCQKLEGIADKILQTPECKSSNIADFPAQLKKECQYTIKELSKRIAKGGVDHQIH